MQNNCSRAAIAVANLILDRLISERDVVFRHGNVTRIKKKKRIVGHENFKAIRTLCILFRIVWIGLFFLGFFLFSKDGWDLFLHTLNRNKHIFRQISLLFTFWPVHLLPAISYWFYRFFFCVWFRLQDYWYKVLVHTFLVKKMISVYLSCNLYLWRFACVIMQLDFRISYINKHVFLIL